MKKVDLKQIRKIRKKHNADLLKRMQAGDSLKSYESSASWFPPRPVIRKDPDAIQKLYSAKIKAEDLSELSSDECLNMEKGSADKDNFLKSS